MQTLGVCRHDYKGLSATISLAFVNYFDLFQLFVVIHVFIQNFIHDEQMFDLWCKLSSHVLDDEFTKSEIHTTQTI